MPNYAAHHWGEAPAVYDEHTLKIDGHEVMEDWEQPYMNRLGSIAAQNGGVVLELGYGMGISSAVIEAHDVDSHVIIECHPDVITRCVADNKAAFNKGKMHLLTGFWQDVTPLIATGTFDGILFDTYPIKEEEMIGPHMFFFSEAFRLLKEGGVLTYYSDEPTHLSEDHIQRLVDAGFNKNNIDFTLCEVTPPENCEYWHDSTIVVPIIRKVSM